MFAHAYVVSVSFAANIRKTRNPLRFDSREEHLCSAVIWLPARYETGGDISSAPSAHCLLRLYSTDIALWKY